MTRQELVAELDILIAMDDVHNEVGCGHLLKQGDAASVLLPLGEQMLFVDAELRNSSGNLDLIICADEVLAGGDNCRRIYVWELKAPQLFLFRVETQGRAAPTKELYSAENQLIHYHSYLAGSDQDRRNFGVLSPDDVRLGGIIIGTSRTFVEKSKDVVSEKANRLAAAARDIRGQKLYRPAGIRLLTWDIVRDLLRSVTSHGKFEQSKSARVPFNEGPRFEKPLHGALL